jgi:hypothetical protein
VPPDLQGERRVQSYEYKVVPAPRRGEKARGARSVPERFAVALTHAMNDLARDGWEYLRADTLPCDERVGLTGTATHFQNMLVFRRALPQAVVAARPEPARPAVALVPDLIPDPEPEPTVMAPLPPRAAEGAAPTLGPAAAPMPLSRPNGRL